MFLKQQSTRNLPAILAAGTLWLLAVVLQSGCSGLAAIPAPSPTPSPSSTPIPTPTATIVWFPPTATATPLPTLAPPSPTPDRRPDLGTVLLNDAFDQPALWGQSSTLAASAAVGGGQLTLIAQGQRIYVSSLRQEPLLSDFYAEINANLVFCRQADEYGLLLRAASSNDFYRFSLSCQGQARLDRVIAGQATSPQPWLYNPAIPLQGPRLIRLGVWVKGPEMRFFLDEQLLFEVRDPLLRNGLFGVFVRSASAETLTINFSDLVIYELAP